jgi:hypothetical protein
MPIEFGMLKFSSANIKISDVSQSLLSTNVAEMIPVNLGSTAQFILAPQMLYHDFTSSDAVPVTSRMPWNGTYALILLKWRRWTTHSLKIEPCHADSNKPQQFTNCSYLSLTKPVTVTHTICADDVHLNVWENLLLSRVLFTRKESLNTESAFTWLRNS